jgi:cyanophycinase
MAQHRIALLNHHAGYQMTFFRRTGFLILAGVLTLTISLSAAQDTPTTFIAIGGGYADTYDGVIAAALQHASGESVNILVLPTAYASSAATITDDERKGNLADAETRRSQIEAACTAAVPAGKTCNVTLVPIFTRADALDEANQSYFSPDLAAVFILGGDQTVLIQAIMNTLVEAALQQAYHSGTVIAGTSAGLSVQSRTMIGGYLGAFDAESGFHEGAMDVWNTDDKRGLPFGLTNAILEQHFWERGRLPRLLNALSQPDVPHVGVGVDTYTAATFSGGTTLSGIFGQYDVAVFDAETFGAAQNATYKNNVLDIHNVLFHLLAPGDFSYDLGTRQTSIDDVPGKISRKAASITLPDGAGTLLLAGNLGSLLNNPPSTLARFKDLVGTSPVLVIAVGYPSDDEAQSVIVVYGNALGTQTVGLILKTGVTAEIPPNAGGYGGLILVASDQSAVQPEALTPVLDMWHSGKPLLLDNAAAAIAGQYFAADPPIAARDSRSIQTAFLKDQTHPQKGLALLPLMIEPDVISNGRWGRLVALAYIHPDVVALGLPDDAALEISPSGARVIGTNGVITLDLSSAALEMGDNHAYVFANGLLDVFAPGETIQFADAK